MLGTSLALPRLLLGFQWYKVIEELFGIGPRRVTGPSGLP